MTTTIEVTRRGRITIPKALREELRIEPGQKYHLRALDSGVLVLTTHSGETVAALRRLRARLKESGATLEEMLAELRRMRESDE